MKWMSIGNTQIACENRIQCQREMQCNYNKRRWDHCLELWRKGNRLCGAKERSPTARISSVDSLLSRGEDQVLRNSCPQDCSILSQKQKVLPDWSVSHRSLKVTQFHQLTYSTSLKPTSDSQTTYLGICSKVSKHLDHSFLNVSRKLCNRKEKN